MKMTKKIMSLAIVFAMVMAMSVSALAADITVTNAQEGETYKIYKIFDATFEGDKVAYTIAADSAFKTFVDGYTYNTTDVFTLTASKNNADVLVVTVNAIFTGEAAAKDFADKLYAAINAGTVTAAPVNTITAGADEVVNFGNLNPGYYFVTTSLGSLCALDSQLASIDIKEKNSIPTITKTVQEDDGAKWGEVAYAQIGQDVNFNLNVAIDDLYTQGNGIDADYTIVDTLPVGMTVKEETVAIEGWTKGTDFTVSVETKETGDVMTIVLKQSKLVELARDVNFDITYTASVDADFAINTANVNTVVLTYHEQEITDTATVKAFQFGMEKTDGTKQLTGAKFELYKSATGTDKVDLVFVETKDNVNYYRLADATEVAADEFKSAVIEAGKVVILGVDTDDYYLEETEAPAGYNILTAREKITATEDNAATIDVVNQSGTELPSTGGIGTTIFYALGGLMAVGAGVLLVAKKRMEA